MNTKCHRGLKIVLSLLRVYDYDKLINNFSINKLFK